MLIPLDIRKMKNQSHRGIKLHSNINDYNIKRENNKYWPVVKKLKLHTFLVTMKVV
jgi:hypothetical protein